MALSLGLGACGSDDPPTVAQAELAAPNPSPSTQPPHRSEVVRLIAEVRPALLKVIDQEQVLPRAIAACRTARSGKVPDAAAVQRAFAGPRVPTLTDKQARTIMTGLRKHLCAELPKDGAETTTPPVR